MHSKFGSYITKKHLYIDDLEDLEKDEEVIKGIVKDM
jgi:hypothetical protein